MWRTRRSDGSIAEAEHHRGARDGLAISRDRSGRVRRSRFANEVYLGTR